VARAPLFRGLPAEAWDTLVVQARERRINRHESFFQQGDRAEHVFVLCSGRLKITQFEASGEQIILRLTSPGEAFGAIDLEPESGYPVGAMALEASYALAWDRGAMDALARRHDALLRNIVRILCVRARDLEQRCRELTIERVPARLARALLRLASQVGRAEPGGTAIGLSREEMGQLTGATLFTVSRLLGEWQERRLVCARREVVLLVDAAGLAEIARGAATFAPPSQADGGLASRTLHVRNERAQGAR
jgi:CRP-like cAMP-binding protein